MEQKIGEIFEYDGEWYQCVESACNKECYFYNKSLHKTIADINGNGFGACNACFRNDNKSVIFKKLEKDGEPFIGNTHIQLQRYKIYAEPIINSTENVGYINEGNIIAIEIKQNKGNMEEKKLNLKPFDLEAAKAGKPVCTRDGRKARILCFDRFCCDEISTIVACVLSKDGKDENVIIYSSDGFMADKQHPYADDLMMLPEKKEGWVNIYDDMKMYASEERAKIGISTERNYITTTKVEWEE